MKRCTEYRGRGVRAGGGDTEPGGAGEGQIGEIDGGSSVNSGWGHTNTATETDWLSAIIKHAAQWALDAAKRIRILMAKFGLIRACQSPTSYLPIFPLT